MNDDKMIETTKSNKQTNPPIVLFSTIRCMYRIPVNLISLNTYCRHKGVHMYFFPFFAFHFILSATEKSFETNKKLSLEDSLEGVILQWISGGQSGRQKKQETRRTF